MLFLFETCNISYKKLTTCSEFSNTNSNNRFWDFPIPVSLRFMHFADFFNYFHEKPNGFTPLTRTLNLVLNDNPPHVLGERKLLIVIATDGEPTDTQGKVNIPEFRNVFLSRPSIVYTSIVACTDDDGSIGYLNRWDKEMPRLGKYINF